MDEPALHEALAPVGFLLGHWVGGGQGHYPTIEPFEWREETRFWHVGRPVLLYMQTTRDAVTGEPRHAESGFLRAGSESGHFEFVVAHNTGFAELAAGPVSGPRLELRTSSLVGSETAKDVTALTRTYEADGPVLRWNLSMEAVGEPMTHHLEGALTKSSP
jgi:hypothetical protein